MVGATITSALALALITHHPKTKSHSSNIDMAKTLRSRLTFGLILFPLLLLTLSPYQAMAATPTIALPNGTVYIGDEVYGVAGPAAVNCVDPAYVNARP